MIMIMVGPYDKAQNFLLISHILAFGCNVIVVENF